MEEKCLVEGKKMIGEGTPAPYHLDDGTGRPFEEGVAIQTPAKGSSGIEKEQRGGGDRPTPMSWGWSLVAAKDSRI